MVRSLAALSRGILFLMLVLVAAAPSAAAAENRVQTAWRLLDYLSVDYAGAVRNGRVTSQSEYGEMREFSASVTQRLEALPTNPQKPLLISKSRALEAAIAGKSSAEDVGNQARSLGAALLSVYPVALAPKSAPDLSRGARLYADTCAACHGATGRADTPGARALNPPPIAFADRGRARERSTFALYQVISQGLEGTAMQSFAQLPDEDRWALAFEAGRFAYPPELAEQGRRMWASDARLRARIPDLQTLVGLTPAALAKEIGEQPAAALMAYLRSTPEAVDRVRSGDSLDVARARLAEAAAAYAEGDRARAGDLALSAYLEGFEPVEGVLTARDAGLVSRVESAMGELRSAISKGAPRDQVAAKATQILGLFDEAQGALAPGAGDGTSTFFGAFAILLREGLEALLIVVAMIGFLNKADRPSLVRHVHLGWVSALAAGFATWWVASNLITISGASREFTEGFGSLLAAAILVFVGVWMHGKAQAGAWQRYVKQRLDHALSRGSVWFLFSLAFIAVYREAFETIIFFAALGAQGQGIAMLAGVAAASAVLGLLGWSMLRFSRKLPLDKFFTYSAALIAVLAVVLAGKGTAALQEAGLLGLTLVPGLPRVAIVGLFPTVQTIGAQLLTAALLASGFLIAQRRQLATQS